MSDTKGPPKPDYEELKTWKMPGSVGRLLARALWLEHQLAEQAGHLEVLQAECRELIKDNRRHTRRINELESKNAALEHAITDLHRGYAESIEARGPQP